MQNLAHSDCYMNQCITLWAETKSCRTTQEIVTNKGALDIGDIQASSLIKTPLSSILINYIYCHVQGWAGFLEQLYS